MPVKLGDRVKDKLTPLQGVVWGRTEYLFGCVQVLVNPGVIHEGKPVDSTWLDEDRVDVLASGVIEQPASAKTRKGGAPTTPPPARR